MPRGKVRKAISACLVLSGGKRHCDRRRRIIRPLVFERLEDRAMLSVFTVTNLSDAPVAGAASAPGTLRQAVFDANNLAGADTIEFAAGLSGAVNLSVIADTASGPSALVISSPITIQGNANGVTIGRDIAGPDARLLLVTPTGNLTLNSLMLTGGVALGADGMAGTPNGGDGRGGAIFNQGTVEIMASTLYENLASGGDAAAGGSGGSGLGGAIFNDGGTITIINSTLSGNSVESGVGITNGFAFAAGVYSRNGMLSLSNSTITNNSAAAGRGVYVLGDGAAATAIIESTIIGQTDSSFTLTEIVVTAINDGRASSSGAHNLIRRGPTFDGSVVSTNDPAMGPLVDNGGPTWTHALSADSPAVNQGNDPHALSADQRGGSFVRIAGGDPDIGAFERQMAGGPTLAGDYNRNTSVDAADYVLWRSTRDDVVAPFAGADGSGDGLIDAADFGVWYSNFGRAAASAAEVGMDMEPEAAVATELVISAGSKIIQAFIGPTVPSIRTAGAGAKPLTNAANSLTLPVLDLLEWALMDMLGDARRSLAMTADGASQVARPAETGPEVLAADHVLTDWPVAIGRIL